MISAQRLKALRCKLKVDDAHREFDYLVNAWNQHFQQHCDEADEEMTQNTLLEWIKRRNRGEPLALIRGNAEFWSQTLKVSAATLIPRPDSETLIDAALALLPPDREAVFVDAGCGSGNIAAALCSEYAHARVIALDKKRPCCSLAAYNLVAESRAWVLQADWLNSLRPQSVDAVLSNPPYLADDDVHLPSLAHEPRDALIAGATGLECYDSIIEGARYALKPQGCLLLECAPWQREALAHRCVNAGLRFIKPFFDLGGRVRVIGVQKP